MNHRGYQGPDAILFSTHMVLDDMYIMTPFFQFTKCIMCRGIRSMLEMRSYQTNFCKKVNKPVFTRMLAFFYKLIPVFFFYLMNQLLVKFYLLSQDHFLLSSDKSMYV